VKVSIIIPVYNERPILADVVRRVVGAALPPGCQREVIVVDDGSTDGSGALLDREFGGGEIVVHHSATHVGKGSAVRAGIARASGDVILVQDGDLEYDPDDYREILTPITHGTHDADVDVVYGSRFLPEVKAANLRGMKWSNRMGNRMLTVAANLLFGADITDEATGYKAFRAPLLKNLTLSCRRFEFCPEVTAKIRRLGYVIHEVPIHYSARGVQQGKKIRYRDGVEALWTLIKWRLLPVRSFSRGSSAPVSAGSDRRPAVGVDARPPDSGAPEGNRAAR
jgi:glycosyltransferase involved in cell wall biosynthesis